MLTLIETYKYITNTLINSYSNYSDLDILARDLARKHPTEHVSLWWRLQLAKMYQDNCISQVRGYYYPTKDYLSKHYFYI